MSPARPGLPPGGGSDLHPDLGSAEFIRDPYPVYARLRREDPVHESPRGYWLLTRYDDVVGALRDPRLGNEPSRFAVLHARNRERHVAADVANDILPFIDPPRHGPYRRWVAKAFREQLRNTPPPVDAIAEELLAASRARGELDLIRDFGTPLSVRVISRILGVPEEDEARLTAWSELFFYLFVPIPSSEILDEMNAALETFREYFLGLIEVRRKAPRDDLISRFLALPAEDGPSTKEIADTCMLLFADGVENIDRAIANGVVALLDHPAQLELLRREPERIDAAVDECLRFDPPAQLIGRVARENVELRGKVLRKDQPVLLMLAAANRDPEQFDAPNAFDITRRTGTMLSFGRGRHLCIGAPLVRQQMAIGISQIVRELRNLRRAHAPLAFVPRMGHRWLTALPVSFDPA